MRILGIDRGSTSLKAVEIDTAFGRYDIHDHHEIKIVPGADPKEAITKLLASLSKQPDRIIVSLRAGQATFRNLELPTKDKKAIQASVGFELDDDLPFPLEQSTYDYSILSQTGNVTHVFVATTMRKYVTETIENWKAAGADPDIITTDAWAYRTLLNRTLTPEVQQKPAILVQIGHDSSVIYLHWRGFPIAAREIKWGGRELTLAICRKYGITIEQAESAKLDHGFVLPPSQRESATPEQIEFSDTMAEPLKELVRHMRTMALTCKNVTHNTPGTILTSGGTSLLPGLSRFLEEEFSIPASALQSLTHTSTSGISYSEQSDASFALAAGLALCLVKGPDKTPAVNLRKGSQAKVAKSGQFSATALRRPILALGSILVSMLISLSVQSSIYSSRLADIDSQLERSVKNFFSHLSSGTLKTYMSSTSTLKTSVNKELAKNRDLAKLLGPNPKSPINFLSGLSTTVPQDMVVDMTQFQVGASPSAPFGSKEPVQASLTFQVENPQLAEKLAGILQAKINDLGRSKIEEVTAADGTTKKWKVTFSGKPTEDAYGN
jgi:type IV pilus assembly protein PilM